MIVLSWPDKALSPNARKHWRAKIIPKKNARLEAWAAVRQSRYVVAKGFVGKLDIHVTHHPPDRRRRDLDNCIASFKHFQDGIADALDLDDARFCVTHELSDNPTQGGKIVVELGLCQEK